MGYNKYKYKANLLYPMIKWVPGAKNLVRGSEGRPSEVEEIFLFQKLISFKKISNKFIKFRLHGTDYIFLFQRLISLKKYHSPINIGNLDYMASVGSAPTPSYILASFLKL